MTSVKIGEWLARRRKWLVTVATFLAGIGDLGLVHGDGRNAILVALLALNSVGVHQVPNEH